MEIIFTKDSVDATGVYEIDPADAADADGDGVVDAIDNCPNVLNANQEDADFDEIGDSCDNCIHGPNPGQGAAPLGQEILATTAVSFSWTVAADAVYVTGDIAAVATYGIIITFKNRWFSQRVLRIH